MQQNRYGDGMLSPWGALDCTNVEIQLLFQKEFYGTTEWWRNFGHAMFAVRLLASCDANVHATEVAVREARRVQAAAALRTSISVHCVPLFFSTSWLGLLYQTQKYAVLKPRYTQTIRQFPAATEPNPPASSPTSLLCMFGCLLPVSPMSMR